MTYVMLIIISVANPASVSVALHEVGNFKDLNECKQAILDTTNPSVTIQHNHNTQVSMMCVRKSY